MSQRSHQHDHLERRVAALEARLKNLDQRIDAMERAIPSPALASAAERPRAQPRDREPGPGREGPGRTGGLTAAPGDRLVIKGHRVGEPDRDAEILEVRGVRGAPPYLVRWSDDGHVGLVFPGGDAVIQHFKHRAGAARRGSPAVA